MSKAYELAKERYAEIGVDTEAAMARIAKIPVSVHCWQGDDVRGFEDPDGDLTGGIQTTGNYPGRARNIDQLRADIDKTFSLVPGTKRLNLHAIYLDNGGTPVERDKIEPKHFTSWVDFAKERKIGLDFNPTCFSHKLSSDGLTLSHPDKAVRDFWIDHCIASRKIAEYFGKELGNKAVTNYWVPDGFKDITVDRYAARARYADSLDKIMKGADTSLNLNAVESKVFGIGAESCTVGSHEFYMGYAVSRGKFVCLDSGHFHPTESIGDKLSAIVAQQGRILLHVSRGVRWDSDHVILLNDELLTIAREAAVYGYLDRIWICLDYFDASINRVAAMAIGARNKRKALLIALLEPTALLRQEEDKWDFSARMARQEEVKTLPWGDVWRYYCESRGIADDYAMMDEINTYERDVLLKRG